jgi:type III restriction enzyme
MAVEIRFDANQEYQRNAIDSVVEVFAGQEMVEQGLTLAGFDDEKRFEAFQELVFGNTLDLAPESVRRNLRRVQESPVAFDDGSSRPVIPEQERLNLDHGEMPLHFSVEMETGTGKTYVYVRTIAELHLKYGFRKFVIVVPSVAIREGVLNSLALLKQHVRDIYDGLQYDHHVYDSTALTRVRQFATASHLQVMVVNIAAMTGDKENRIIHRPTEELNDYAPINFLQACRPIVIMDEPQSLDGPSQAKALETLQPLFRVGYSATPPDGAHLVYRLTPVDAYNQRLVKRIGVLSLVKDVDVNEAYVEVSKVTATSASVTATATIHKATAQGTKPTKITLHKDDDLFEMSGGREVYRGWVVEDILADRGDVQFQNGQTVSIGGSSSASDDQQQRLLLRQAVEAHFEKELQLLQQHRRQVISEKIKPLTLFFIEKVDDYAPAGSKVRAWFEDEYARARAMGKFRALQMPDVADVHDGYFAVDRKGVAKEARADSKDAADAFERIMRRKQDLLGFEEPLRFIFSHSALAEGWDNPNVFTICNLQDGRSKMRKRQQVGRGLRLPVMAANGERCHVDDINVLTVIAKESFASFAEALQREIEEETGVKFSGRIIDLRKRRELKLKEQVLDSAEFNELWSKIAPHTTYRMDFSTDAVVSEAVRRIGEMPAIERVKFRITEGVIRMGSNGLSGTSTADRGTIHAEAGRGAPDVVGELCRRLPISRATIVRILRECGRLGEVDVNPAVFMDQVAEAIRKAVYTQAADGIVYRRTGEAWAAELIKQRHQAETVAPRVVAVKKSITDHIVCDSEVEQSFAEFLDTPNNDVPLFVKLPEWFKVSTPLGNYNPDWAFVRDESGRRRVYLVRETKGTDDIERLQWESEGWKIKFGQAHFAAIGVDYAFGKDAATLIRPTLAEVLPFRVKSDDEVNTSERYRTHLPVYSLRAAAGGFSDAQDVESEGWAQVEGRLASDMFIAQVVGRSMEPTIPDGAYCVFQRIGAGTRRGKIVLAQHRDVNDPDTGGSYTVKEYASEYSVDEDAKRVGTVTLRPHNTEFAPIVITASDEDEVSVVAAFVRAL